MKIALVLVFAILAFPPIYPDEIVISIDCNKTDGIIKKFAGINCGPLGQAKGVDLTEQYKQIGIDFIRTHDFYGPTDISSIFPNWNASVGDEKSYNFSSSRL